MRRRDRCVCSYLAPRMSKTSIFKSTRRKRTNSPAQNSRDPKLARRRKTRRSKKPRARKRTMRKSRMKSRPTRRKKQNRRTKVKKRAR